MANLTNLNNKFLVTTGGAVLINQTSAVSTHLLTVNGRIGGPTFSDSYLQFTGGNVLLKANDDIKLGYNQNVIVKQSGIVLIGNTAPLLSETLNVTGSGIMIEQGDGGVATLLGAYGSSDGIVGTYTNSHFHIRTNNNNRITVLNGGNVGIGTNSPANQLQVANAGEVIVRSSMTAADGYRGGFEADNQHTGGTIWSMFSTNNSDGYFGGGKYVIANESMGDVDANTTAKFVINGSGNVGIGTSNPQFPLDIHHGTPELNLYDTSSAGQFRFFLDGVAATIKNYSTNGHISLITTGTGNVGIGTTSPSEKLEVDGNIQGLDTVMLKNSSSGVKWQFYRDGNETLNFRYNNGSGWSANAISIKNNNNVGIGTYDPGRKLTVTGDVSGDANNLLLSNENDTDGDSASIGFSMLSNNTYVKSGIFFERTTTQGRGSLHLAVNNEVNGNNVTKTDAKLTINNSGNVGIGTTSPSKKLDVLGTGLRLQDDSSYSSITIGTSGWSQDYPYQRLDTFASDGTGYFWAFGHKKTDGTKTVRMLIADTSTPYVTAINQLNVATFATNQLGGSGNYPTFTTNIVLRNSGISYINGGNVGIGLTNPDSKLYVKDGHIKVEGNATDTVFFEGVKTGTGVTTKIYNNSNGTYWDSYAHSVFRANQLGGSGGSMVFMVPNEAMRINSNSDVGIGTSSPGYKLEVNGSIAMTDYMYHVGDADTYFGFNSADSINFVTNNVSRLYMDNNGFGSQTRWGNQSTPDTTHTSFADVTNTIKGVGVKYLGQFNIRDGSRYLDIALNSTADNVMFYIMVRGYLYNRGSYWGWASGYTYQSGIINKSNNNIMSAGTTKTIDTYRGTNGTGGNYSGNLCIRFDSGANSYSEGYVEVYVGSHSVSWQSGIDATAYAQNDESTDYFAQ